jgi:hypothetical protein
MRFFLSLVLPFLCSHSIGAAGIDKATSEALEHIRRGYIQYGFEELKKVAAVNNIAAQFYVAVCYEKGIAVDKNPTEAFKMYRKAAERGLPDAMYYMAAFYRDGIVVSQDATRESQWIQRYEQKGGRLTLPDLVAIYNEGIQNPANYAANPNGGSGNAPLVAQNGGNAGSHGQTINNITIVQQQPTKPVSTPAPVTAAPKKPAADQPKSDIDMNIPTGQGKQPNSFALIIANENYQDVAKVPNALNDGKTFAQYCEKTLGLPKSNIKYVQDATLNGIKRQLNWLKQVMEAYQGEASVIFYYAGHGIPDEKSRSAYLLPVDGFSTDVSSGYCLDDIYAELGSQPAKSVIVLLDACFSGAQRDGNMLASARGVAIKAKQNAPKGNMVVLSAAQGDETAYPYKEKGHGMFTYYLLKKIQETHGQVTIGELADYVTTEVKKQSIVSNGKMQTPVASPSANATGWENWKLSQ